MDCDTKLLYAGCVLFKSNRLMTVHRDNDLSQRTLNNGKYMPHISGKQSTQ